MMTRGGEVPSHVIFRAFTAVLQHMLGQWLCGKWGSRGAKRRDRVYPSDSPDLLTPATLCQIIPMASHFSFPLLSVGVKDWSTTRRKRRGSNASQHLSFDRTDLIFSFLSPSPHQQSCPNESDLAERPNLQPSSQKCQKLLLSIFQITFRTPITGALSEQQLWH